jgi:serine/threonine protein kinase
MLSAKMAPNTDIKIIDFGLAHRFQPGEEYKCMSGTPQYIRE